MKYNRLTPDKISFIRMHGYIVYRRLYKMSKFFEVGVESLIKLDKSKIDKLLSRIN